MTANANGAIVQIIGAVIDVEFRAKSMPQVYDALVVEDRNLTLECSSSSATAWSVPSPWVPARA